MPVEHVLLDADGVLQRSPHDPYAVLRRWAGARAEELAHELWAAEKPALRGEEDFLDVLARVLPGYTEGADPAEVHAALWLDITVDASSLTLARRLREQGAGVHLATNQHRQRGEHMRTALGYDDLLRRLLLLLGARGGQAGPRLLRAGARPGRCTGPRGALRRRQRRQRRGGSRRSGCTACTGTSTRATTCCGAALAGHGLDPGDR